MYPTKSCYYTTVLFHVDPGDSTGYAFLEEGTIQFVDYNITASGSRRLWQLRRGLPPVELFPPGSELDQWVEDTQYFTDSVWQLPRKPLFKRPSTYIIGGAVGVGTWLLLRDKTTPDHTGSVVIGLP